MLGANELPLRQVFGLCPKRLYGALVSPARRPVPVRRKISRLTQYFILNDPTSSEQMTDIVQRR